MLDSETRTFESGKVCNFSVLSWNLAVQLNNWQISTISCFLHLYNSSSFNPSCFIPFLFSSLLLHGPLTVSPPLSSLAEIMRMYQGTVWWRTDRWSLLQQPEMGEKEGGLEKWDREKDEDKNLQVVREQRKME